MTNVIGGNSPNSNKVSLNKVVQAQRERNIDYTNMYEKFTYGKRLGKKPSVSNIIKNRLIRLEERRQQRITLKTLYEKKSASICGDRDRIFAEKVAEQ